MSKYNRLEVDRAKCTACRSCELACHYHLTGNFGTASNKIIIKFDHDSGDVAIQLSPECASCVNQPEPGCVNACIPGALSIKQIDA